MINHRKDDDDDDDAHVGWVLRVRIKSWVQVDQGQRRCRDGHLVLPNLGIIHNRLPLFGRTSIDTIVRKHFGTVIL
jgi:hypothetical protein